MQNILKLQDALKNLSDQQLAQEMQSPSGRIPQFLIMTEMNRRNEMRNEAKKAPEGTVADELVQQAMQPQGIMNLPDETLAGAAMRARISGQQQQAPGGMVAMPPGQAPQQAPQQAMPPQGMAGGGSVKFGNIFGDTDSNTGTQASGTPDLVHQNYTPTNSYVAPSTTDYSGLIHNQFDPYHPPPHNPNPRVHASPYAGLDLPKGIAMPTEGTAGLVRNMSYSMKNPQFTGYSWASPAYRDAYIRYMTPPAATTTATQGAATTTSNMAGGGPAHFDGTERSDVTLEDNTTSAPRTFGLEDFILSLGGDPYGSALDAVRRNGGFTQKQSDRPAFNPPAEPPVKDTTPAASAVSGPASAKTEAPSAPSVNPSEGGIASLPKPVDSQYTRSMQALKDMLAKYENNQGSPVGTYVPLQIPAMGGPAKPSTVNTPAPVGGMRDYAGETKSEINKLLEGLAGDSQAIKQRDRDMALAQAGFAIAASKNPQALGAIGEGAQAGMADYIKNRKEARALDAERIKAQIAAAASAGEMGQRQGLSEAEMGQRERLSNAEIASRERIAGNENALRVALANQTAGLQGKELELKQQQLMQTLQQGLATLSKPNADIESIMFLQQHPEMKEMWSAVLGDPNLRALSAAAANPLNPKSGEAMDAIMKMLVPSNAGSTAGVSSALTEFLKSKPNTAMFIQQHGLNEAIKEGLITRDQAVSLGIIKE